MDDCEECGGVGTVMEAKLYPSGHYEDTYQCAVCDGSGAVFTSVEDYDNWNNLMELLYG